MSPTLTVCVCLLLRDSRVRAVVFSGDDTVAPVREIIQVGTLTRDLWFRVHGYAAGTGTLTWRYGPIHPVPAGYSCSEEVITGVSHPPSPPARPPSPSPAPPPPSPSPPFLYHVRMDVLFSFDVSSFNATAFFNLLVADVGDQFGVGRDAIEMTYGAASTRVTITVTVLDPVHADRLAVGLTAFCNQTLEQNEHEWGGWHMFGTEQTIPLICKRHWMS